MAENEVIATNYIYLLQLREFVKTKENVYKVGRTTQENHKRFAQYPKGSVLLFQMICNDCVRIEKDVLEKFRQNFKQRKDLGNEYFEGDYKNMIDVIYLIVKEEGKKCVNENKVKVVDENKLKVVDEMQENKSFQYIFNPCCGNYKYVLFNPIDVTFVYCDGISGHRWLPEWISDGISMINMKKICNIDIVDNILKSLLPKDIISMYKKLVHNLLVKLEEKEIIFYDYNQQLMTLWIKNLFYLTNINYCTSYNYYSNGTEYKKIIASNKYRCVIIEKTFDTDISIEQQINQFREFGIKIIIICQNNSTKKLYDLPNYRKYINDINESLMKLLKEESIDLPEEFDRPNFDEKSMFLRPALLETNFLKWCCIR